MSENVEGYKEKVDPRVRARVEWTKDLVFTATTPRGYDLDFDAKAEWGCMPTEALLMSLAGCMAIDVISILEKMQCPPESFSMEVAGERRPTPPQYFTKVTLILHVKGEVPREKLERAVRLSEETYCSVHHSLRRDMEIVTEIRLNE